MFVNASELSSVKQTMSVLISFCCATVCSGTSPPVVKTKPADVYRSALKKHSEAFHLCAALDPVQCIKRLHSKQHVSRSTVKDIERSAVKGRHTASIQCLSHVLQLSDAGLCYFVDKYLCAQHLDSLAETVVNCPGDGVCKLDSAEHHHTVSTSTTAMATVSVSAEEVIHQENAEHVSMPFRKTLLYT